MQKSSKLYKKAVKTFEKGNINKAIEITKKSIQCNKSNSSSLNFIGLLYYFKGDLNNAQKMWNINYKYNGNKVSKKYLEDSKNDKERLAIYIKALKLYEEIRINEALAVFNTCKESDFNSINLNNYIASCYIKKGDYKRAENHINKVLAMDKYNVMAIKNKKLLMEYGHIEEAWHKKKIVVSLATTFIIITFFLGLGGLKQHTFKNNALHKKNSKIDKKSATRKSTAKKTTTGAVATVKDNNYLPKATEQEKFNLELLDKYIKEKDFYNVYHCITSNKREELTINEKLAYDKGVELIKNEGVESFYQKALEQNKMGKIKEAEENLIKAKNFSTGSYLDEHIIYFLGMTYEKKEDAQNSLKYYKEYMDKYPKGNYKEVVLYKLAILNTYNDKNLAKRYAKDLVDLYPKSIYNNSKIKDVLNNN